MTERVRDADDMDTRQIALPTNVWHMVDECMSSGLFGDDLDEVMLSLIRSALVEAATSGLCTIRGTP